MVRRVGAVVLGLVAAALGGELAWLLVRSWLRGVTFESGAYTAGPEVVLVVAAGVIPGVTVTILAWRRLIGPPLVHIARTLDLHASKSSPTLMDLIDGLATVGHRITAIALDDAGHHKAAAATDAPLRGASLELTDATAQRGRLVLRLPPPSDGDAVGFLDSWGSAGGHYETLAATVEATLADLLPDLRRV